MPLRVLPPLSAFLRDAFRLARSRLGTLAALVTFPFVPLLLFSPFIIQVLLARDQGAVASAEVAVYVSPWTAALAFVGLLLGLVVSVSSTAGVFLALAGTTDPGPRTAFREGARRWVAFFWTWLLSAFALTLSLLPGALFFWWAQRVMGVTTDQAGLSWFVLLVSLLLSVPAFLVVTWYAVALIPAARGEAWGSDALRISHRLVHGATGQVFGLLFAWFLFELLFSILLTIFFPGLPLFTGFAYYYATTILGSAYLCVIYRVLRRA